MKEAFRLLGCRFHINEKDKMLAVGCLSNNDMKGHEIRFLLDDQVLDYSMEEISLKPIQFGRIDGALITKRYYLWIELPKDWETFRQLKIVDRHEKEEEIATIDVLDMKKISADATKYIDIIRPEKNGFHIEGWFIGDKKARIWFLDMNGKELPVEITEVLRPDVLNEYPEIKLEEVHGFSADYKGKVSSQIKVCFETDDKYAEQTIKIHDGVIKETLRGTFSFFRKIVVYWVQFGTEATILRAKDKLSRRTYTEYEEWFRRNQPFKSELRKQRRHKFKYMPKISIVVPLYKTPEKYLDELIESVCRQTYENWELCLSDGSGKNSPMTKILEEYEKRDRRIKVVHNERQLHISDNTNEALKIATGDYIAFSDHDDLLAPDALYECVCMINAEPETELIYSDEDKINMDGTEHFQPHFKPDFNLELLRSNNYICHLAVIKRALYEKAGMLDPTCDGAQDFDYMLRCVEHTSHIQHIPKILYHWRAHKDSTAESVESKPYITQAGKRAVQRHYDRLGIQAEVMETPYTGIYFSKFELAEKPLVSVIIPNKDHIEDLDKCIRSLEEKSTYKNLEYIIVENNSQNKETFSYYKELEKNNKKARVLYWKGEGFNYPAINNYGVKYAKGDYLLFLNNDTEILSKDCIEQLLVYGMRDDVGAVGAKMYYDDETIQHAGVIIGLGGVAGHAFVGVPRESVGYFCRAVVPHNLSAVTAACMLMRRKVYDEVGGFDERYAVAFNDVDLCMKIRKAGYLIVFNPHAELYHYESKSRGYDDTPEKKQRFMQEIHLFHQRWREILIKGDPYYNPNLTLNRNDFSINVNAVRERR